MNNSAKKPVGVTLLGSSASFRVWAPFAKSVAVSGTFNEWSKTPLINEGDGYWGGEIQKVEAGQEYKFVINDGNNKDWHKNDPRALQMTTSTGSSVISDTNFDWGKDSFEPLPPNQQVIYELHIGTFNRPDRSEQGTFETAMDKLDHLEELGVNMIELMPISTMADDRGWGYATDYIYSVESLYGGRKQFLEFVKKAHKKGIGVILDVVYNHFGPGGGLDLWQFDGWNQDGHGGIYFYNDWRSDTPWGATRPDFGRLEVRDYIIDNVKMWMNDCHLDGLRIDSTIYIRNVKGRNNDPANDIPDGWSLLQDINTVIKESKPSAVSIAEDVGANEYITKQIEEGGTGFTSQWEVNFPSLLRSVLDTPDDLYRNLSGLVNELNRKYNNDVFERIVYSDSHDSAANGSARLSEEISPGDPSSIYARKRCLIAAGIVLTAPGVPMLLQGQEFMQGGSFNDWQALNWKNAKQYSGIVDAHKHLIALRKNQYGNSGGLTGQNISILQVDEVSKILAYSRSSGFTFNDDVVVIINLANREYREYPTNFPSTGLWYPLFNSNWKGYSKDFENKEVKEVSVVEANGIVSGLINIAPYSIVLFAKKNS
jgi:1,4-alpha-glucan branching enzyme